MRLLETQILRVKRNIEAIKRRFSLGFVDSTFLDEFVPSTLHSVEQDLVSAAAAMSDVDYMISRTIGSYRDVTNALMQVINEHAYREKENLVERLCKLLE